MNKHSILISLILLSSVLALNFDINQVTVSGLSSGAFFAVQMHVAFSKNIQGAAVFAGGPFYCAQGAMTTAVTNCMSMPAGIAVEQLYQKVKDLSSKSSIDDMNNLNGQKVFLFSGQNDKTVNPGVVKKAEELYNKLGCSLKTEYSTNDGHAMVSLEASNTCSFTGSPYINQCNYDGANVALTHLLGSLNKPGSAFAQNVLEFNQSSFVAPLSSLGNKGYVYVPQNCQKGQKCRLHVVFHGCQQTLADIGMDYVNKTGYNEVAEANDLIIFYPQIIKSYFSPSNPQGCWDWFGYTENSFLPGATKYVTKSGVQMNAVWAMIESLLKFGNKASKLGFLEEHK